MPPSGRAEKLRPITLWNKVLKNRALFFRASLLSFICRHEYNFRTLYIFSVFVSIQQFGNWLKFPAKKSRREAVKTVYIRHIWFAAVAERPVYNAHAERVKGYALMLVIYAADYRGVVSG